MPIILGLRKYEPIWEALKQHGTVTIRCNAKLHKRVCKAVIKEKSRDMEYKLREGWRMKYLTYYCNPTENTITFFLQYRSTELLPADF